MNIIYKKVEELIPYVTNPRKHNNVTEIANSIKEFGFRQPIVLDSDNKLIIGHGRLLASKQLGLTEVPCIIADDLSNEQVTALRIADNKTGEMSEWDENLLELELLNIDEIDMSMFGFDLEEEVEEAQKELDRKNKLEAMELKAFEHHDYIVFAFDNQQDWLNAVNKFDIGKVDAGYGETKKVGVGRVINGKRLLEKI